MSIQIIFSPVTGKYGRIDLDEETELVIEYDDILLLLNNKPLLCGYLIEDESCACPTCNTPLFFSDRGREGEPYYDLKSHFFAPFGRE